MTDERLEEALRVSGAQHVRRPLPPALRDRLLGAASRPRGLRAARRMVLALVIANAVIAAVVVVGGIDGRGVPSPAHVAGGAGQAGSPATPPRTALDLALIDGHRIVLDALQDEGSACREGTPDVLPADLLACRGSAVLVGQAASGFSARLLALSPADAVPGVADLIRTLSDLRASAQRLVADVDARAPAAIADDSGWVAGLSWAANMALVFEPLR